MSSGAVLGKIDRLRAGHAPRVLDLFAGCGGLSLGFSAAGCEIVGAVESDHHAAATHGLNFHPGEAVHAIPRDMETSPTELAMALGLVPVERAVDVLVGGPPCQAFARIGRSKLRDIRNHPQAFRHDPRAGLYLRYLEYVLTFQPLVVLIENVPDILRYGDQNVPEEICISLEQSGYRAAYTLLNAAHYGVPQYRERMFLVALRTELGTAVSFPEPTHHAALPRGYQDHRKGMLDQLVGVNLLGPRSHAAESPRVREDLAPAVTVEEALHDLPPIVRHTDGEQRPPDSRSMGIVRCYDRRRRVSAFARLMKEWPGFENWRGVPDHVIRNLPRDWRLFAGMREGDHYVDALRLAETLFEDERRRQVAEGKELIPKSDAWYALRRQFVPPYPHDKFVDKWRKMIRTEPARTLTAHLGRDCYSHIHYDSCQARTLSVREAARLQSFPDGFVFTGGMNAAFRQIGNAVPPLLAKALAVQIRSALSLSDRATVARNTASEAGSHAACA